MKGYTDIHAHFVYGMDDGAQTREEMCAMLDAAEADGIGLLYATPHVVPGVRPFDWETYERRLREARAYCGARGYGMELRAGAETVLLEFFFQYDGCALEKLYYEQELCDAEADGYLENGRGATNGATKENTLVLRADFSVGPEPREDGFSPDSRHAGWKFILIRADANSPGTIDDRGY